MHLTTPVFDRRSNADSHSYHNVSRLDNATTHHRTHQEHQAQSTDLATAATGSSAVMSNNNAVVHAPSEALAQPTVNDAQSAGFDSTQQQHKDASNSTHVKHHHHNKHVNVGVIIGVLVGVLAVIVLLVFFIWWRRKREAKRGETLGDSAEKTSQFPMHRLSMRRSFDSFGSGRAGAPGGGGGGGGGGGLGHRSSPEQHQWVYNEYGEPEQRAVVGREQDAGWNYAHFIGQR